MSENIKKSFPKFKKQLQWFLMDESGKVTKEDVLKIALGAMMVWGIVDQVDAACSTSSTNNSVSFGVSTGISTNISNNSLTPSITNAGECVAWVNTPYSTLNGTVYTNTAVAPYTYDTTINGHANGWGNATIQGWEFNGWSLTTVAWHGSHGSHWSHWSHWSRW